MQNTSEIIIKHPTLKAKTSHSGKTKQYKHTMVAQHQQKKASARRLSPACKCWPAPPAQGRRSVMAKCMRLYTDGVRPSVSCVYPQEFMLT